ncbi:MAG: restriction endonuclease [Bacillota bacterium]
MSRICTIHKTINHERMHSMEDKIELYCPKCELDKLWEDEKQRHDAIINNKKKSRLHGFYCLTAFIISLLFWQNFYHSLWYWIIVFFMFIFSYSSFEDFFSKPLTKSYEEVKIKFEQERKRHKAVVEAFKAKKYKEYQKKVADISVLDNMNGFEFEEYVADLLRKLQYKNVKVTRKTGDNGVDILAEKNSRKYAIQCKRNNPNNKLSNAAIQQVFTGKQLYKCSHSMVITTSYFTEPAWKTGKELGVTLWARNKLIEKINKVALPYITFEQYLEPYYVNHNNKKTQHA